MSQPIAALLDSIFNEATAAPAAIEKTAEARLFDALREDTHVEEDPFDSMTLEELTKLASENGLEVGEDGEITDQEDAIDMDKIAMDTLGGQVMAHSAFHELEQIKIAMINGACRVCKSNAMDIEGSSICSTCLS
jgi:hypothetical protein